MAKRRAPERAQARPGRSSERGAARPAARPAPAGVALAPFDLAVTADRTVETVCLAAVVCLPLYFSVLTTTGYEADKATLLRALAAVATGGWLIAQFMSRETSWRREPLVWLATGVMAAYTLAAILSIDPRLSILGSQTRQEGLDTRAAYLVFFLCAATQFRSRRQIERLLSVLIVGSLPAVVYGFCQQLGLDPIPIKGGDPTVAMWPVRSSLGQHVFFGGFLVLLIPVTAARLLSLWRRQNAPDLGTARGDEGLLLASIAGFIGLSFLAVIGIGFHLTRLSVLFPAFFIGYAALALVVDSLPDTRAVRRSQLWMYAVILALQVLTLAFTGARGPWLGFFASVPVFAFLTAWWLKRPRIWWTVLVASVLFGAFVFVLNIQNGPLQPLRTTPMFKRLGDLTESAGGTVGSVRGRIDIWNGVETLFRDHPGIGGAWGGPGRDFVGYGPESMPLAFEHVYPLELRRLTFEVWTWDRAHDIYLDTLIDAGILGLAIFLATIAVFGRRLFLALRHLDEPRAWIAIGLLGAVAGHLVEGVFGIETPVSLLLLWMFLGLGVALGRAEDDEPATAWSAPLPRVSGLWSGLLVVAAIVAALPFIDDHPTLLALLWLVSILAGLSALLWIIWPASGRSHSTPISVSRGSTESVRSTPPRTMLVAVALGLVLILAGQFQYEVAAFSELAGYKNLVEGNLADGLGALQQAVWSQRYEPVLRVELSTAYLNFATSRGASADPGYRPTDTDTVSLDPQKALVLGRDQLLTLAADAARDARGLDPLNPQLDDQLGGVYLAWHKSDAALAAFLAAERLSHQNPKYLARAALAASQGGKSSQAVALGKAAIALDPKYWYSHFALAQVYHAAHDRPAARNEASLALFWSPVTYPPVTQDQIAQMKKLQSQG